MNFEYLVKGTLSQDSFVMVNKKISKRIGFVEAGLLAELLFVHEHAKQTDRFFEGGIHGEWFYLTQAKVEENLGIKRREHENAIKNLVQHKIIQKKKMGLPAKNYYLLNWENIANILAENDEKVPSTLGAISLDETYKQESTKRTNKDGRNVQTRVDETSIHTIDKKELEKRDIKTSNKNLVNKELENNLNNSFSKIDLLDIANEFYSEFALNRYTKKQWITVTNQLIDEIIATKVDLTHPRKYIKASLENIVRSHDLKHGKVDFEDKPQNNNRPVPFYNWLEQ